MRGVSLFFSLSTAKRAGGGGGTALERSGDDGPQAGPPERLAGARGETVQRSRSSRERRAGELTKP